MDGIRVACSNACKESYLATPRPRVKSEESGREPTRVRITTLTGEPAPRPLEPDAFTLPQSFLAAAGMAIGAAVLAFIPAHAANVIGSLLTLGSLFWAIEHAQPRHQRERIAVALGPLAVVLGTVSAALLKWETQALWLPSLGAAFMAIAVLGRQALASAASAPLQAGLAALQGNAPTTVRVASEHSGGYEDVSIREIRIGDEVYVFEGEVVGVDGIIEAGDAWIVPYTGAPNAFRRSIGDAVLSTAKVTKGNLRVRTSKTAEGRSVARLTSFGTPAHSRAVQVTENVARASELAALVLGAGWAFSAGFTNASASRMHTVAGALLLLPTLALRRGTADTFVAAACAAMRRGIAFSAPRALESAGAVSTVVINKDRAVTTGSPRVMNFLTLSNRPSAELVSKTVGAVVAADLGPIARALTAYAGEQRIGPETVRRARAHIGRGVTAVTASGEELVFGTRQLLLEFGISIASAETEASEEEARARTVLFLGVAGKLQALVVLHDDLKTGTRSAMQHFFDRGVAVVLMSEEHRNTVEALAKELDIALIKAEVSPHERAVEVAKIPGIVAGVGHHPDDESLLDAVKVPIVLRGAGAKLPPRSIALASGDLADAAAALTIAQFARSEALRVGGVVAAVGIPTVLLAIGGWLPALGAAFVAIGIDAFVLRAGVRISERIDKRLPPARRESSPAERRPSTELSL